MNNLRYKTVIQRFGALIVDGVLFLLPFILLETTTPYGDAFLTWVFTPIWLCYSIFFHGKYGQTIGKMVAKVKVVNVNDEDKVIGFYKAGFRETGTIFLFMFETILHCEYNVESEWLIIILTVAWTLAEIITLLSNPKQRAIHDFIASSVVIDIKQHSTQEGK